MQAKIGNSPEEAVCFLKKSWPVALPTETVYGLAAPLLDEKAILKIYQLKQRPLSNPLIVHVLDKTQLLSIAEVPSKALKLVDAFWPGPLTLILKKKKLVPDLVTSDQNSVAIRAPACELFRTVLTLLGQALVAPSANKFQQVSPTCAQHVFRGMGNCIPYILDGGPCKLGVESTILSLLDPQKPTLLRYGPISKEALEAVLNQTIGFPEKIITESKVKLSPGLFKKHYSPQTPLYLLDHLQSPILPESLQKTFNEQAAHVFFRKPFKTLAPNEFFLTLDGDLSQAATNLFALLQDLDQKNWCSIWIERVPNQDVGCAINDRLTRAAAMVL